jgi:hypothetical protein
MMYGEPPTSIGVAFNEAEAFAPLARIVEKTGWCVLDPEAKGFVDITASRTAGRTVLVGDEAPGLAGGSSSKTTSTIKASIWKPPSVPQSRIGRAVAFGLAIGAVALGIAYPLTNGRVMRLPALILATQSSATRFEKYPDRLVRRKDLMEALPSPYRTDKIVEQMIDAQMAARAYRNFVDGRFTSPELLSKEDVWSRFQMPSFLPATFAQRQRDGYEFEFAGENCEEAEPGWPECRGFAYIARPLKAEGGVVFALYSSDDKIHVRTDGRVPTKEDRTLDATTPPST